jgi:hypothetical protein
MQSIIHDGKSKKISEIRPKHCRIFQLDEIFSVLGIRWMLSLHVNNITYTYNTKEDTLTDVRKPAYK